jgi:hypothetical protein
MSSVTTAEGPVSNSIAYETVTVTAKSACTIAGPPILTILDASGSIAAVTVYREDGVAAPGLALVPGWGRQIALAAGDKYQFQFAWVRTACPQPSSQPPTATTTAPTSPPTSDPSSVTLPVPLPPTSSSAPPVAATSPSSSPTASMPPQPGVSYTVHYTVYGTAPAATYTFSASCGAAIYVTDIFQAGQYPQPPHFTAPLLSPSPSS